MNANIETDAHAIITVSDLSKTYPSGTKAVDHISFTLKRGDIFGFLGPNGAGKTTTIKLLCGMLAPTGGSCRVYGVDPAQAPEKLHQISGVVTEHAQMYDHLSGLENLVFYGNLFGMARTDCEKRAAALLQRLDLYGARGQKLSTYSTGMRQRLSLARALMHSPEVLFLDEPTSGLDPESAQNVNTLIKELAAQGTTVFLCTHQLRYAQEICTTYGLMDHGRLFASGTIDALRNMVSGKIKIRIETNLMPHDLYCENIGANIYDITVDSRDDIPGIVKKIALAGGDIYHVSQKQLPLEDIYFALVDRNRGKAEDKSI